MQRLGAFFAKLSTRYLPDPMALACGLTVVVVLIAIAFPQSAVLSERGVVSRAAAIADIWLDAVWNRGFLVFALQMCVVLLTGFALARAPMATRLLNMLSDLPRSARSAVTLVALVSCIGCWINWGFGLVLAGLLAARVTDSLKRRKVICSQALIVAAAYAGMMIWHGGLSGSAPLKVASEGVEITASGSISSVTTIAPIAIDRTIFSTGNLLLTLVLMAWVVLFFRGVAGGDGDDDPTEDAAPKNASSSTRQDDDHDAGRRSCIDSQPTPADRFNRSRVLAYLIVALLAVGLSRSIHATGWRAVGLNFVNSAFLALGLLLHGNLASYIAAIADGGRAIAGIVIQFPLYSGIQGVMFGAGLAAAVSQWFIDVSIDAAATLHVATGNTFPVATFASAAVVNFFVPSGGGQWIVQGPIMCGAASTLKLPVEHTVMAVAYGDQLTNMIQPFWAIPLIGLTRVHPAKFMGYCALLMLTSIPIFVAALLLL